MTIIVIGEPHDVLPLVEQLAADHGGVKEMQMSRFILRANCEDGSRIETHLREASRGYKADEVWVPSSIDREFLQDIVIPMLMGHADGLHYFSEKGF